MLLRLAVRDRFALWVIGVPIKVPVATLPVLIVEDVAELAADLLRRLARLLLDAADQVFDVAARLVEVVVGEVAPDGARAALYTIESSLSLQVSHFRPPFPPCFYPPATRPTAPIISRYVMSKVPRNQPAFW